MNFELTLTIREYLHTLSAFANTDKDWDDIDGVNSLETLALSEISENKEVRAYVDEFDKDSISIKYTSNFVFGGVKSVITDSACVLNIEGKDVTKYNKTNKQVTSLSLLVDLPKVVAERADVENAQAIVITITRIPTDIRPGIATNPATFHYAYVENRGGKTYDVFKDGEVLSFAMSGHIPFALDAENAYEVLSSKNLSCSKD